jgi:hypothetical protein
MPEDFDIVETFHMIANCPLVLMSAQNSAIRIGGT